MLFDLRLLLPSLNPQVPCFSLCLAPSCCTHWLVGYTENLWCPIPASVQSLMGLWATWSRERCPCPQQRELVQMVFRGHFKLKTFCDCENTALTYGLPGTGNWGDINRKLSEWSGPVRRCWGQELVQPEEVMDLGTPNRNPQLTVPVGRWARRWSLVLPSGAWWHETTGTNWDKTGTKKEFFPHKDNQTGKQAVQGGFAISELEGGQDLTGHNTEKPGLTSVSRRLGWRLIEALCSLNYAVCLWSVSLLVTLVFLYN